MSKFFVHRSWRNFFRVDWCNIYYIFLSWNKRFSFRPPFVDVIMFPVPSYPTHTESNLTLWNKVREQWFLSPHKCSNYVFHTGSFPRVVSYFHRTLSCWQHGPEIQVGNFFPLCRNSTFKLTLKESINKSHSVDRVGVQKPLRPKHHYTRPNHFLERNFLWIHCGHFERNIFQCLGGEDS